MLEFSPIRNCPACNAEVAVRVVRKYRNALGVLRVRVRCPTCACEWREDHRTPEKEIRSCQLPN
jgi:endogenous inhibitor of DNA gyrase (YacG/DUF329 family)